MPTINQLVRKGRKKILKKTSLNISKVQTALYSLPAAAVIRAMIKRFLSTFGLREMQQITLRQLIRLNL